MTTQNNPVYAKDAFQLARSFVVTTDQAINLGDLCWWDAVHFTLKALSSPSQVAAAGGDSSGSRSSGYVGASLGSTPAYIYGVNDPGSDPANPAVPVLSKGGAWVNGTAGETYSHFDAVTIGADAQTVTSVGVTSSNRVGFVLVDPPVIGSARTGPAATPVPEHESGRIVIQLEPKLAVAIAL